MRCSSCQAEQSGVARYCDRCGARLDARGSEPDPLDVVPEARGIPSGGAAPTGTFAFTPETGPATVLEASERSYPMRVAVALWLVISALLALVSLFQHRDAITQLAYPFAQVRSGQVSSDDALRVTQVAFYAALLGVVVWVLVKVLLAMGAYRGTSSTVFYLCMAIMAVNSALALLSLAGLGGAILHGGDVSQPVVALLIQLTAAALLAWMVLGLRRYGPWASRPRPVASA
ncbi:MAG TPA: hypothetical protein VIN56_04640 [Candidatus Dormibacteraeota bacterium]|jgi:hypothetical protein